MLRRLNRKRYTLIFMINPQNKSCLMQKITAENIVSQTFQTIWILIVSGRYETHSVYDQSSIIKQKRQFINKIYVNKLPNMLKSNIYYLYDSKNVLKNFTVSSRALMQMFSFAACIFSSCSELILQGVQRIAVFEISCIVLQSVPPNMRYGATATSG